MKVSEPLVMIVRCPCESFEQWNVSELLVMIVLCPWKFRDLKSVRIILMVVLSMWKFRDMKVSELFWWFVRCPCESFEIWKVSELFWWVCCPCESFEIWKYPNYYWWLCCPCVRDIKVSELLLKVVRCPCESFEIWKVSELLLMVVLSVCSRYKSIRTITDGCAVCVFQIWKYPNYYWWLCCPCVRDMKVSELLLMVVLSVCLRCESIRTITDGCAVRVFEI
jgi:hypothetical protein